MDEMIIEAADTYWMYYSKGTVCNSYSSNVCYLPDPYG